ncbi:Cell cycle control protein 50A [Phytophthora pseudosyringae]|uniref:Cell cycle control protein 50A n=1 Tax=Phytophthora pseudosyringae TaxID=221518 RepID=A0A8T1W3N2_9STRA|nr:Cell cycle control protein 50A [Phytophthora pseudosyringae]
MSSRSAVISKEKRKTFEPAVSERAQEKANRVLVSKEKHAAEENSGKLIREEAVSRVKMRKEREPAVRQEYPRKPTVPLSGSEALALEEVSWIGSSNHVLGGVFLAIGAIFAVACIFFTGRKLYNLETQTTTYCFFFHANAAAS